MEKMVQRSTTTTTTTTPTTTKRKSRRNSNSNTNTNTNTKTKSKTHANANANTNASDNKHRPSKHRHRHKQPKSQPRSQKKSQKKKNQNHGRQSKSMNASKKKKTIEDRIERSLEEHNYVHAKKLGATLQGQIWRADIKTDKLKNTANNVHDPHMHSHSHSHQKQPQTSDLKVVVKCAKKVYYNQEKALVSGDDMIREFSTLQTISKANPPSGIVKCLDFFEDSEFLYLVMEDSGSDLFSFVDECHKLILNKQLSIPNFHVFASGVFRTLLQVISWLHEHMKCCHMDISLENVLIQFENDQKFIPIHNHSHHKAEVKDDNHSNTNNIGGIGIGTGIGTGIGIGICEYKINPKFTVSLCDFGAAEIFSSYVDLADITTDDEDDDAETDTIDMSMSFIHHHKSTVKEMSPGPTNDIEIELGDDDDHNDNDIHIDFNTEYEEDSASESDSEESASENEREEESSVLVRCDDMNNSNVNLSHVVCRIRHGHARNGHDREHEQKEIDFRCFADERKTGKPSYVSPKIYKGKTFDARLSDCWSFGVTLLIFLLGQPLFAKPDISDHRFKEVKYGRLKHLLQNYKRAQYLSPELYDLFEQIFQDESQRINAKQMLDHPWFAT